MVVLRALICFLALSHLATAQRFHVDDPVWEDEDRIPIAKPNPIERSDLYDLLFNSFVGLDSGQVPPARNVNTLGEVPDSSWFTNRIGVGAPSLDELVQGPNEFEGPDRSGPLRVVSVKAEGRSPGFTVKDGRGDTYLIKFDPRGYAQLSTSAEVISTRFFHAFGYHVPENYLLFLRASDLAVSPEGTIEEAGRVRSLRREDLDFVLSRVGRRSDGSYPALASRYLPGAPLGPFYYHDTRSDDPNDIFPHQDRRELRALRLFSAFLEHHDSRSMNTLDMYMSQGDGGFVRHHLIDFGSTLGATPLGPRDARVGHEYFFELEPTLKAAVTLGIWDRPWRAIQVPDFTSVGTIEAASFAPDEWKPEYPNPAFDRMLTEDAFWAAKIIHRFTDERISALVEVGRLDDRAAEDYLIDVLIRRRDKIAQHYFAAINPLDGFRIAGEDDWLQFDNLGLESGLASEAAYSYRWFRFDNDERSLDPLAEPGTSEAPEMPIPESAAPFLMVRIHTEAAGLPRWESRVDVYLCRRDGRRTVVGIERQDPATLSSAQPLDR